MSAELQPIYKRVRINFERSITHGTRYTTPIEADRFGAPEALWRHYNRVFNATGDPKAAERAGAITTFVDKATQEHLVGKVRFDDLEEFVGVLDNYIAMMDQIAEHALQPTTRYFPSATLIQDLLGMTGHKPRDRVMELPTVNID